MSNAMTSRILICIPIVHSEQDMGSLGRCLPASQNRRTLAQARWGEIDREVRALALDWRTATVYQDGLPDASPEIIRKILAEVKSPNYDLIRWLVSQGATLVGTESVDLIKEEYDQVKKVLLTKDPREKASARLSYAERAPALLVARDAYIARRIAESLASGRVGLLFIGEAHQVARHLPADISVRDLNHSHGHDVVPATTS